MTLVAALRADLHNTSAREFNRVFEARDFMPGAPDDSIEARAQAYIKMGYTPSEAAAMATSRQTREHKLHVIDSALSTAHRQKQKGGRRKVG